MTKILYNYIKHFIIKLLKTQLFLLGVDFASKKKNSDNISERTFKSMVRIIFQLIPFAYDYTFKHMKTFIVRGK